MRRHELLQGLHELVQPRTYLEIGVQTGRSLRYSRTCSIGVDPAFHLVNEVLCDLHLVRATSDEFFARQHPLAHFPFPAADLAFIDGMHLAEYALRDLINVERLHPADQRDRARRHAAPARRRGGPGTGRGAYERGAWAGDVYKVVATLRRAAPRPGLPRGGHATDGHRGHPAPRRGLDRAGRTHTTNSSRSTSCPTRSRSPTTSSDELVPSARRTCSTRPSGRASAPPCSGPGVGTRRVCARNSTGSALRMAS